MIALRDISKSFRVRGQRKVLFNGVNLVLPPCARVALIGANGAGKSTLLGLIAGTVAPDRGRVDRLGTVSWPMGFAGGFAADLSGRQNLRFVARIYGAPTDDAEAEAEDFAELGRFLDMPVRTYSAGMRARLAFAMSMALKFDWYLVDEIAAVGDARFREKSLAAFRDRLDMAGLVMVSHAPALLRDFCTSAVVLQGGRLQIFQNVDDAIGQHEEQMLHATDQP